jgi:hypothetical protein
MPAWQFWILNAAIAISGSVVIWFCDRALTRFMDRLERNIIDGA